MKKTKQPTHVILTQYVNKVGQVGDTVRVAPGYARNFLFPTKKAVPNNEYWQAHFRHRRKEFLANETIRLELANEMQTYFETNEITVKSSASKGGSLYGSVDGKVIAKALEAVGQKIDPSEVVIPGRAIRDTGTFKIVVIPHPTVEIPVTLHVEAEEV